MKEIFAKDQEFQLNLYKLSFIYDIRLLVLKTLLIYLELDGYIHERTTFFSNYRFQPIVPLKKITQQFSGERGQFLQNVFQHSKKARIWFHIDINKTAEKLRQPRRRFIRALDYLHENKFLFVKTAAIRHRYTLSRQPDDILQLGNQFFHRFVERESKDINRIQQVLDLITHNGCQTKLLVGYFGEERLANCGHCNWCMNGNLPVILQPVPEFSLTKKDLERIETVRQEHQKIFSEPRALARFSCGITSPKISRAKLSTHKYFGLMANIRFHQVLKNLKANED